MEPPFLLKGQCPEIFCAVLHKNILQPLVHAVNLSNINEFAKVFEFETDPQVWPLIPGDLIL
jgi:hypothetical protein